MLTGASQSAVSSSSSFSSVIEQPCHLQRGDVGADEVAADLDARGRPGTSVELVVDDVQLDQRRAAHAVDEGKDPVTRAERQVLDDRRGQHLDDLAAPAPASCAARPGSPWMPMPISISSSPSSKVGLPAAGTVHEVSAMPMLRPLAFTLRQRSATSASDRPCLGRGTGRSSRPARSSPTPRRPAVYRLSCTATSSSIDDRLDLDAVLARPGQPPSRSSSCRRCSSSRCAALRRRR